MIPRPAKEPVSRCLLQASIYSMLQNYISIKTFFPAHQTLNRPRKTGSPSEPNEITINMHACMFLTTTTHDFNRPLSQLRTVLLLKCDCNMHLSQQRCHRNLLNTYKEQGTKLCSPTAGTSPEQETAKERRDSPFRTVSRTQ